MKTTITLAILLACSPVFSQVNPIDFETAGNGADWTWTVFENSTNPALEIVPNPFPGGINTSATVAKFTALQAGQPFAGCETMHGSDIGTFTLTADNAFVAIMVYKTEISDVGIKFATFPGASTGEIKVPNTVVNQWERIVIDFTGIIGEPSSTDIDQLIVFPDFQARGQDNVVYFDNIVFGDSTLATSEFSQSQVSITPNPVLEYTRIASQQTVSSAVVYSISGQKLIEVSPNSTDFNLNLTSLKSGVYFVQLVGDNGTLTKQLIKQ